MNYEDFLKPREEELNTEPESSETSSSDTEAPTEEVDSQVEIDVQKAVVESLAADKAVQEEKICSLEKENECLRQKIAELTAKIEELSKEKIEFNKEALAKIDGLLAINAESSTSNQVSLIDRDMELPDRFPGETRDHVLDAIKEARDKAEADGRIRRAQVLEAVLVANEPSGNLATKKANLEKFFNENQNILSGPVIEELQKYGISHKKGDEYLLPAEIIKRTY